MTARTRKVERIVVGRGLAAAALAVGLVQAGRRVALLVETPGWERGTRPAWRGWHSGPHAGVAAAGEALLEQWLAEGLPGIGRAADAPWTLDLEELLPALGARVAAGERCWLATGTRVRGVSVIEGAVLGAIAEDARYDAKVLVNAAEDARFAALARMMRQPDALELEAVDAEHVWPEGARATAAHSPQVAQPTLQRDRGEVRWGESSIAGAWRVQGVAGWPLLALGAAAQLLEALQ